MSSTPHPNGIHTISIKPGSIDSYFGFGQITCQGWVRINYWILSVIPIPIPQYRWGANAFVTNRLGNLRKSRRHKRDIHHGSSSRAGLMPYLNEHTVFVAPKPGFTWGLLRHCYVICSHNKKVKRQPHLVGPKSFPQEKSLPEYSLNPIYQRTAWAALQFDVWLSGYARDRLRVYLGVWQFCWSELEWGRAVLGLKSGEEGRGELIVSEHELSAHAVKGLARQ